MEIFTTSLNYFVLVVLLILTYFLVRVIKKPRSEMKSDCCGKGDQCCSKGKDKKCSCEK